MFNYLYMNAFLYSKKNDHLVLIKYLKQCENFKDKTWNLKIWNRRVIRETTNGNIDWLWFLCLICQCIWGMPFKTKDIFLSKFWIILRAIFSSNLNSGVKHIRQNQDMKEKLLKWIPRGISIQPFLRTYLWTIVNNKRRTKIFWELFFDRNKEDLLSIR